jgi:hypothetical protein
MVDYFFDNQEPHSIEPLIPSHLIPILLTQLLYIGAVHLHRLQEYCIRISGEYRC